MNQLERESGISSAGTGEIPRARARRQPAVPGTGRLAVIVPYFQRRPGLLRTALLSVFAQEDPGEFAVFVVDDGSPCPAADEVAALEPAHRDRVRIIEQRNAGPAAARNRALAEFGDDVELIAFLDSDDRWHPAHVRRARRALADADVYVANWMPLEAQVDAYTHYGRLDLSEHQPLGDDLWRHLGDFFAQELLRPIGRMSTLVYHRAPFKTVRFDARLSCAFEDRLFRLELAMRDPRVAFSTRPEVESGEGVNVFSSARWGRPERLDVARDEILAARVVRESFELDRNQRAALAAKVRRERLDAWTTWLRIVASGGSFQSRRVLRLVAVDPAWWLAALVVWWPAARAERRARRQARSEQQGVASARPS